VQIVRYAADGSARAGVLVDGAVRPLPVATLAELLERPAAEVQKVVTEAADGPGVAPAPRLLPPVDGLTEVWASGVTYRRSSEARQEESQVADVYARVYDADRPELFFKSPAWRVSGAGEPIGIRPDSEIDVPEPELALVCTSSGEIVGVTACNDVSSRSIEGENPLYLPQAKIYAGACALGPAITPIWTVDPTSLGISIEVRRGADRVWSGKTSTSLMHRDFADLVEHLYRHSVFPQGAVLSTGTGLVPELSFSLQPGDEVRIAVEAVGELVNPVRPATAAEFAWLTPDPARAVR
jgi:2-dehydro-3-deoxy-D-arabinonate dehydratase